MFFAYTFAFGTCALLLLLWFRVAHEYLVYFVFWRHGSARRRLGALQVVAILFQEQSYSITISVTGYSVGFKQSYELQWLHEMQHL